MMTNSLAIVYRPEYWVHALLAEIAAQPNLTLAHQQWASPETQLSDLAFSIETRLGNLRELVRFVDENLYVLSQEFDKNRGEIDGLIAGGYAYQVEDERALRRVLLGVSAFATESRGCFEAMAKFYMAFVDNYFGEQIKFPDACSKIESLGTDPTWAGDLKNLRHQVAHTVSPWIEFEQTHSTPPFEPVLLLDWRPGASGAARVKMGALRMMKENFTLARERLRSELIARVRNMR